MSAGVRWAPVLTAASVVGVVLMGAIAWTRRTHDIVYRASGEGCALAIRYTHAGDHGPLSARDAWTSSVLSMVHGETASVVVSAGPGCEAVHCELEEDGTVVAVADGTVVAMCSAWTAR